MYLYPVFLVLLILLSGVISGTEAALFSLDAAARERVRNQQKKGFSLLLDWLARPNQTLAVLLLANLMTNTAISWVTARVLEQNFPEISGQPLLSLALITVILLVFAEIMPKVLALQMAEKWLFFWLPLLRLIYLLAEIVARPVSLLTRKITARLPDSHGGFGEKELLAAIQLAGQQGALKEDERKILRRSVAFFHDTAYSTMLPKSQVFMLSHNISLARAKKSFQDERAPIALIYHEKEKNILGYLHIRSLVLALSKKQRSLRNRMQPILYIPETLPLRDVLQQFIRNRSEVAAVIAESGEFSGIITLKDILGKIIGGWEEEFQKTESDEPGEKIRKKSENEYWLQGDLTIHEFNEYFQTALESISSETISGLLVEELDGYPRKNTVLRLGALEFSEMELKNNRILRVKMQRRASQHE